jgi:lysophospholipid acyltransferase (LPLAT)-like uncharacterized protein
MVKIMRSGVPGAMFPDGPKGPRGDFKIGTIILAQLTDAYIVPMTYSADPAWILKNWDQFMIAKPFARTVIAYGEPVKIPRSLDDEQMLSLKSHLEDRMNDLIAQADRYLKQDWK